jgi:hypothetical protein
MSSSRETSMMGTEKLNGERTGSSSILYVSKHLSIKNPRCWERLSTALHKELDWDAIIQRSALSGDRTG